MEQPRKVDVPLPPDERKLGCAHWIAAGCLVLVVFFAVGGYLVYRKYVRPLYSGVTALLAETDRVQEVPDSEVRSLADSAVTVQELEEDPAKYRGRYLRLRAVVESDEVSNIDIKNRSYRLFRIGESTFVVARRPAGDLVHGDVVEVIGMVSEVDVSQVLEKIAPGAAASLSLDHVVVFIAKDVTLVRENKGHVQNRSPSKLCVLS